MSRQTFTQYKKGVYNSTSNYQPTPYALEKKRKQMESFESTILHASFEDLYHMKTKFESDITAVREEIKILYTNKEDRRKYDYLSILDIYFKYHPEHNGLQILQKNIDDANTYEIVRCLFESNIKGPLFTALSRELYAQKDVIETNYEVVSIRISDGGKEKKTDQSTTILREFLQTEQEISQRKNDI